MGYAHGIKWDKKRLDTLIDLLSCGFTAKECALKLTKLWGREVTVNAVNNAREKHHLAQHLLEKDTHVVIYDKEIKLKDCDVVVSSDQHSPHHSEKWTNRKLTFAEKHGIKIHVAGGDLFDMSFAKWSKFAMMKDYGEKEDSLDDELVSCRKMLSALDYFDKNHLICGNHENRVDRLTDGKIQARHIIDLMGEGK
ncbi:MAG: hypothetical protein KAJ19_29045, partial [Gammaproteobacteria bacterium]|nr:hypothetical protein [Gammaproteobacteria bacterium]